jgi:ribosomal protein S18 acetylase RimI-like enzyme
MINDEAEARRIEELLLNATQPREQLQYDGWLLRLARNDVKRASSVNAAYGSSLPLEQKIEHCEQVYAEHGVPAIFRLTPFSQPAGLDEALAARGYERFERTLCMSASLDSALPAVRDDLRYERPHLSGWLEIAAGLRRLTQERKQAEYERLFESTLPGFSLIALLGDEAVACGLVMVEDDYAGLFDVCTAELQRGEGIGTALSAELMRTGRLHGARRAWLSVLDDNAPALRVYEKLGFKPVCDYWYRRRPAS